MKLIIKIAWRNIQRHRGKSIVIGLILFIGALFMTIGNGVISGMDEGLKTNIVNSFTGDIILMSDKQTTDNVFLDPMGKAVEPISNFKDIEQVLLKQEYIDNYLPVGKNMALLLTDNENGAPGLSFIMGVDFDKYQKMFPDNMKPIEGRLLQKNEKGTIVPTGARKEMFDNTGIWFKPEGASIVSENIPEEIKADVSEDKSRDNVVFMGYNGENSTTDIRLGVKGIIKYKSLNTLWGHFVLMDIESYRQCLGYFAASEQVTELSNDQQNLLTLDDNNLDALFEDNSSVVKQTEFKTADIKPVQQAVEEVNPTSIDVDRGAYNMVLVRTKKGVNPDRIITKLNETLKNSNLGVRAVPWKKALGTIGSMAALVKTALFSFVMMLFVVAIIIIINTLSMAALERTSEIGMMRAVGAHKNFIRTMFVGETGLLSFAFGGAGIFIGMVVIKIISLLHIKTDNDIVQLLFGGDTFNPFLNASDVVLVIFQLALVTLIAVIYPVKVASSITPLDAISRD